jgi:pyridoxine kinase
MVQGRSGNRSAISPLEGSIVNVDPLNTCQFPAHSGYGPLRGTVLTTHGFTEMIDILKSLGILETYNHLLTGFIASSELAKEIVAQRTSLGPRVDYSCDPVLGNMGKFSLPPEELEQYKHILPPIAQVITPNPMNPFGLQDGQCAIRPNYSRMAMRCAKWEQNMSLLPAPNEIT